MVFSSTLFLFLFLPVTLLGYFIGPRSWRNIWLLLTSLLFYAWGEPQLTWVMLASMSANYLFGLWLGHLAGKNSAKYVLIFAIVLNLSALGLFKYAHFAAGALSQLFVPLGLPDVQIAAIAMPLGISFYTFHALSYLIDVYRKDAQVQRNPFDVALYLTLFPQLIAGPILRYHDVADQLAKRTVTSDDFGIGIQRFIVGLGKKVLIANTLAGPCDRLFALPAAQLGPGGAWLAVICYTGQIYFDFSGYSDMAIGLGRMFGFQFKENFQWPYISKDIREFWRRWHISLSTWFRDYLYIPLGGNRRNEWRNALNLLIVFVLCGLWHGASWTFLFWGLYHGAFLALERTRFGSWISKTPSIFRHIYTMLVVMVGWVFFRAETFAQAGELLRAMSGLGASDLAWPVAMFSDLRVFLGLAVAVVAATPILPKLVAWWQQPTRENSAAIAWSSAALLAQMVILLLCAVMLAASTHNPFIYFRF